MNAALARAEPQVTNEDRIVRIESDLTEIKDDVKTVNIRLTESIVANAHEFGAIRNELAKDRTDTERNFGILRTEIADHRADTEKNFGILRAEIADHRAELAEHRADTEKNFGAVRVEVAESKTEFQKGFGALRVEIEQVRTLIASTKLWLISAAIGTVAMMLGALVALHNLKIL